MVIFHSYLKLPEGYHQAYHHLASIPRWRGALRQSVVQLGPVASARAAQPADDLSALVDDGGVPGLVNEQFAKWKIMILSRQINYKWTIFNSYVRLPEGMFVDDRSMLK